MFKFQSDLQLLHFKSVCLYSLMILKNMMIGWKKKPYNATETHTHVQKDTNPQSSRKIQWMPQHTREKLEKRPAW